MSAPVFVHLRLHSEYSVVDGTVRIDDAVAAAARDGMPALALTDLANAFGLIKFYKAARARGVKPIAGCDVLITHRSEREAPLRAVLLVASRAGYLRLCDWLTRAYRTNQYRGRAGAAREWLAEGTDGLIALSGAREGEVGQALLQGNARGGARGARMGAVVPAALLSRAAARGTPDDDALVAAHCRAGRAKCACRSSRPIRCSSCVARISARTRRACASPKATCCPTRARRGGSPPNSTSCRRREMARASPISRGARQHARDRAALQPHDRARQEPPADLSDAAGRHARRPSAREARAGLERASRGSFPTRKCATRADRSIWSAWNSRRRPSCRWASPGTS
jgi:hypothetical protein